MVSDGTRMEMPELIRRQAESILGEFCAGPVPRGREVVLSYTLEGDCYILLAERADHITGGIAIARFCYNQQLQQWTLHRPDPDRQWRFYPNAGPSLNLQRLLRHVAEDPLHAFWP